jgi:hypothetical protein
VRNYPDTKKDCFKMVKKYLKLIGHITYDRKLVLRSSYLVERSSQINKTTEGDLSMIFLDKNNHEIQKSFLVVKPYNLPKNPKSSLAVRGKVSLPEGVKEILFFYRDEIIYKMKVGDAIPEFKIDWGVLSSGDMVDGRKTFTWTQIKRGASLRYFFEYSIDNGKKWFRVSPMLDKKSYEVDFDALPGGDSCKIGIVATDGVLTKRLESNSFHVRVKPCRPILLSPTDGGIFKLGSPITFIGQGFYLEENLPESTNVFWSSSIDGNLAQGKIITVRNLSRGIHTITLTTGIEKRSSQKNIKITIE